MFSWFSFDHHLIVICLFVCLIYRDQLVFGAGFPPSEGLFLDAQILFFSLRLKKKKVSLVHRAGSDIWCPACARMPLPHSVVGFWHFYLILHTHT